MELFFENIVINEAILCNGRHHITGEAIHPCKTYHPNEWVKIRQYIEPYLEIAAPSLVGKPIVVDHNRKLSTDNRLTNATWDSAKSAVVFEGEITNEVYLMFQRGQLKPQVSVGIDWQKPGGGVVVGADGAFIPYSFDFSELSFISQSAEPGDPETNIQFWETIASEVKQSVQAPTVQFSYSKNQSPLDMWLERLHKAMRRR